MTEQPRSIDVREYRREDEVGITALLTAHMAGDGGWPPRYVREAGASNEWLAGRSSFGRWVALQGDAVVGCVSAGPVEPDNKAAIWLDQLPCPLERLAEIGGLVVHPALRRRGISELLTRRCVRDTVSRGYVPVATAYESADASLAMMTSLGWRVIGQVEGRRSQRIIVLLVAPARLQEAALGNPWSGTA